MKAMIMYYGVLFAVTALIISLITYLIYLNKEINKESKKKGFKGKENNLPLDDKVLKGVYMEKNKEELRDLQVKRIEYLNNRENDKIMKEGFRKFESISSKLMNDDDLIKEAEKELVKKTEYKYKSKYPLSSLDDYEENRVLAETEQSKMLTEYWESKGVNVYHYIYSGFDERFINVILELKRIR